MSTQRVWHLKMMALFWACASGAILLPFLPFRVPSMCLFKRLLGIPCPGCGICSSIKALLHGHWHKAWTLNPAGPFVLAVCIGLAAYFTFAVITRKEGNLAKEIHTFRLVSGVTFCLLALQWGYKLLNH